VSTTCRVDKPTLFRQVAESARKRAKSVAGTPNEKIWLHVAESWEFLAGLHAAPCFCGQPSIGFKYFKNGEMVGACSMHLRELMTHDILCRAGFKKPD